MATTANERADILELVVIMFGYIPPGVEQVFDLYETLEHDLQQTGSALESVPLFQSLHPGSQTGAEFAADFLSVVALENDPTTFEFVVSQFNAGTTKAAIMFGLWQALNTYPLDAGNQYSTAAQIMLQKAGVLSSNNAPTAGTDIADQDATEDSAFELVVSADAFGDVDAGDTLTWSAKQPDGDDLPWLEFDPVTRTFSGMPQNEDVGELDIRVTVTDSEDATAFQDFTITVANANDAPVVANAIADIDGDDALQINNPFEFVVPGNTFNDDDVGDSLEYSATLADDSDLPDWLNFDSVTRTFSGTPLEADIGVIQVKVTATDESDDKVSDVYTLEVTDHNDSIVGGPGADPLDGGAGADTMRGEGGNDTYFVDNDGDVVIEELDEGSDLVYSSVTRTLGDHQEDLILTGTADIDGTGNELVNELIGNGGDNLLVGLGGADILKGADFLNGATGADTLIGGAGDDIYYVDSEDDVVTELALAGQGIDQVYTTIDYTLPDNVEHVLVVDSYALFIVGNGLNNFFFGNAGNDRLDGAAGNDTLDGGAGNDTLVGGAGNDLYIRDAAGDVATEGTGAGGIDTVQSSVSYTLGASLDKLVLTGTAVSGTGNSLANTLTGNGAANTLNGGIGNDTLIGGAGNDTLDGGAGNDSMAGGTGNDVYTVDAAGDSVSEAPTGGGTDTVRASVSETLDFNVENLVLTGAGHLNGNGNATANTITGNAGNNILDGKGGADNLEGLGGNDTLVWAATDNYDGGAGAADKLKLTSGNLNLTAVANAKIKNVEQIDLTGGGNNKLTLNVSDVLDLSSTTNTIKVLGAAGDSVDIVGAFTVQGVAAGFRTYKVGTGLLQIDTDIVVF